MDPIVFLSLLIFAPAAGALLLALLIPKENVEAARLFTLVVCGFVLALSVIGFFYGDKTTFDAASAKMQGAFNVSWIPTFDIYYFLGVDGISFPLIMLTTFVSFLAMWASWSIKKNVKGYCILFLLLETGMIGVFMALDFFLFYVFWEVMLLPMYFLIGIWGGPRREYAAIKFFLYTLVGSVLMLIAILLLYFNSDLRELAKKSDFYGGQSKVVWEDLHLHPNVEEKLGGMSVKALNLKMARGGHLTDGEVALAFEKADGEKAEAYVTYDDIVPGQPALNQRVIVALPGGRASPQQVIDAVRANYMANKTIGLRLLDAADEKTEIRVDEAATYKLPSGSHLREKIHSFNLQALAAMGQHTELFSAKLQWWAFLLLLIGFLIKVPAVPVHTWLPDAHVEAPTPISMILAGVLLKMGGYGIIRICYPICPHGGYELMWLVCGLGVVSMIYGAFAALAQKDFKRLVAYSSVSHMGYVVLGFGVWSAVGEHNYVADYWKMGIEGAMFQMIGHGVSSAGMFFMVGIIYDRVHHRNLSEFGGLYGKMPFYTAMAMGLFFAGLGLPGLCGFIGEVFVVLSVWNFSVLLAVIAASTVVLTAGYILWAIQRVYLGAEYKGPHAEDITPSTIRERTIGVTLLVFAIIFGCFPHHTVLKYMDATVARQADELADWTKTVKEADRYTGKPVAKQAAEDQSAALESSKPDEVVVTESVEAFVEADTTPSTTDSPPPPPNR